MCPYNLDHKCAVVVCNNCMTLGGSTVGSVISTKINLVSSDIFLVSRTVLSQCSYHHLRSYHRRVIIFRGRRPRPLMSQCRLYDSPWSRNFAFLFPSPWRTSILGCFYSLTVGFLVLDTLVILLVIWIWSLTAMNFTSVRNVRSFDVNASS